MNTKPHQPDSLQRASTAHIDTMRIGILLQQASIAILVNLLVSLIVLAAIANWVSLQFLIGWGAVTLLVNLSRWFLLKPLRKRFDEKPELADTRLYENGFAFSVMISGLIWGGLGLVYLNNLPIQQQIIIPLALAGMCSGAIFSYWSSIKSFLAFTVSAIVPLAICLFVVGLITEALAISIYLLAIIGLVKKLHQHLLESLSLRHENSSLVDYLTTVNQSQAQLLLELQAKETFLHHTFEQAGVPMMLMDKQLQIIDVNKAACQLFDYDKADFIRLKGPELLHPSDGNYLSPQFEQLMNGEIEHYTITRRCTDRPGRSLWLQTRLSAVRNTASEIEYVVVQAQDLTEQYELNENLQYVLAHDDLTGLPNRIALEKQLQLLLSRDQVGEHVFCYLDLDLFNLINDTYGHHAGDTLLKDVADLLRMSLREKDFLARFSGDEFVVLLTDCQLEKSEGMLDKLLNNIRSFSFDVDDVSLRITASIGVVPVDASSKLLDLLKHADGACHIAKEAGRDRFHLFNESDVSLVQRHGEMRWVARIQRALTDNKLVLYSQPIVSLRHKDEPLPHCELLIRMLDDDGNVILPGSFLSAAERYNLAASIDIWTITHVLKSLEQAQQQGRDIRGVYAINLSGQSLGDTRFYERIIELIQRYDFQEAGAVLCFEITETAAISNMRSALLFMNELRQYGCLFALDDFGSGLSSFAYLKQLPVDFLKIDGMFVRDCVTNFVNLEIVNSMNGIGQVLGLKTIAEFVEDETTLISMQHLGVDMVQGYQLGEPKPWQV